jgi:hypothetical protein
LEYIESSSLAFGLARRWRISFQPKTLEITFSASWMSTLAMLAMET